MKTLLFALLLAPLLHAAEPILWPYDPPAEYLAIDLSPGPEAERYTGELIRVAPEGGWTKEFKTDKLLLRRVEAGTFTMGSPSGEYGRRPDEVQHEVAITNAFHIGVFEITQRQWELVMGGMIPQGARGATRPVVGVSYPTALSFTERLAAKTSLPFTLPTEEQWEYACRAGTTTALNTGKNLTDLLDANMAEAGRYQYNSNLVKDKIVEKPWRTVGHNHVGLYLPNAWGLYDMHGNVAEWCLGAPEAGGKRVLRGGSWRDDATECRSASRLLLTAAPFPPHSPDEVGSTGLRVLLPSVLLTPLFQK